ncbi:ankyrin repeat-containing domain protein [Xylariomycetidae sp. FL0641]|nr:ankyrin repeat-containing domain protein [Xylariomycetidae sp. FL0641]
MPLLNLPVILVLMVVESVPDLSDLASLTLTCRDLHRLANPQLYKTAAQTEPGRLLCWAVVAGQDRTLQLALAAGANPDATWSSSGTGDWNAELGVRKPKPALLRPRPDSHAISIDTERWCFRPLDGNDWVEKFESFRASWTAIQIAAILSNDEHLSRLLDERLKEQKYPTDRKVDFQQQPEGPDEYDEYDESDDDSDEPDEPHESDHGSLLACLTPLHLATRCRNISTVKLLLSRKHCMHYRGSAVIGIRAGSIFDAACSDGWLPFLQYLVDNGHQTNLEQRNGRDHTPLMIAYLNQRPDCVAWLFSRGAAVPQDPDPSLECQKKGWDIQGSGFIHNPYTFLSFYAVAALTECLQGDNQQEKQALQALAAHRKVYAKLLAKKLCEDPAAFSQPGQDEAAERQQRHDALYNAIHLRCSEAVDALCRLELDLVHGRKLELDPRAPDDAGELRDYRGPALHAACAGPGHTAAAVAIVRRLVARGADVNQYTPREATPLLAALSVPRPSIHTVFLVRTLLRAGADPARRPVLTAAQARRVRGRRLRQDVSPLELAMLRGYRLVLEAMAKQQGVSVREVVAGARPEIRHFTAGFRPRSVGDITT